MANLYFLKSEIAKLELSRSNLQKMVLDVNEKAIAEAPLEERKELYTSHDAIIDFINAQTNVIDLCISHIQGMYSKEYVADLKDLIAKQKFYIKVLGGNHSLINHILKSDINVS